MVTKQVIIIKQGGIKYLVSLLFSENIKKNVIGVLIYLINNNNNNQIEIVKGGIKPLILLLIMKHSLFIFYKHI